MNEKTTLSDVLRNIRKDEQLYLEVSTMEVGNISYFYNKRIPEDIPDEELEDMRIPFFEELGLLTLPSYQEIDHKSIMSFYVKECVEDKDVRKQLFYVLRNHDYYDKFMDLIKKLGLYDEYLEVTDSFYFQMAYEWCLENNIKI